MPSNLRFQPSLLRRCSERGCVRVYMYVCVAGGGGAQMRPPSSPLSPRRALGLHVPHPSTLLSVPYPSDALRMPAELRRLRPFPPQALNYRCALWRGGRFVLLGFFFSSFYFCLSQRGRRRGGEIPSVSPPKTPPAPFSGLSFLLLLSASLRFFSFVLRVISFLPFIFFFAVVFLFQTPPANSSLETSEGWAAK